ncbi:MAG: hypothetical protein ACP5RR_08370 [Candidatus Kapaibacteriota bacterium]
MKLNKDPFRILSTIFFGITFIINIGFCQLDNNKWAKLYYEGKSDDLHTFHILPNNDIILAGWTNANLNLNEDIILLRIDETGNIIWQYSYGAFELDYAQTMAPTLDSNIIVGCQTRSFGAGSTDILLLKVDLEGRILWQKAYGTYDDNAIASVIPTPDGGYLVGGWSYLGTGRSHDATIFKTDRDGNLLWSKHYGTKNYEGIKDMIPTYDGNYIFVAMTSSEETQFDIWLVKIDTLGNIIWEKSYGGNGNDIPSTILNFDGFYYIIGYSNSFSSDGKNDMFLLVVDDFGNIQWAYNYPNAYSTTIINASPFANDKILATGSAIAQSSDNSDLLISILKKNGLFEKGMLFVGNDSELGFCIKQYTTNSILAGGYSYSFSNDNSDIILIRTDSSLSIPDGEMQTKNYLLDAEPHPINFQTLATSAIIDTTRLTVTDALLQRTPLNFEMRNLNISTSQIHNTIQNDYDIKLNANNQIILKLNKLNYKKLNARILNLLGQEVVTFSTENSSSQYVFQTTDLGIGFYLFEVKELNLVFPFIRY